MEFAIGRYGSDDWRLLRYDGSQNTVDTWNKKPTLGMCIEGLMDYHGTGDSPFSSRQGAVNSHVLSNEWPLPVRDLTIPDETLSWE
jgi:hypothetical protein